jgi:hypothetical protein
MEIPRMKRSPSGGSLTIQFHLWNIAGRDSAAYLAALTFHCTFVFALSTAFTCLHAKYSTQNPKAKSSINAKHRELSLQGEWKFGEYSHFLTHQTAKEDSKKRKKMKKLNYLPYRFWFRPNPEESSDSHHRISRTSRAVQQARLDVQASGWE